MDGWAQPRGAMKKYKSCKEEMAAKKRRSGSGGHRLQTRCQQELFIAKYMLKMYPTLPLVIGIHNMNSCVRSIRLLYICFTCER